MDLPGMRYKVLARRCREAADATSPLPEKERLLRMARAYDRHAEELEQEFRLLAESAKSPIRTPEPLVQD